VDKVVSAPAEAVLDMTDGSSLAVTGFGLCGIRSLPIRAALAGGATNLVTVNNICGVDDRRLRCLRYTKVFGSDWPVCRVAATHSQVVEPCQRRSRTAFNVAAQRRAACSAVRAHKLKLPDADIGD
jgi:hypothetical protein